MSRRGRGKNFRNVWDARSPCIGVLVVLSACIPRSRCVFAVRVKSLRSPYHVFCQSAFARRLFRTVRNERRGLAFRQVRLRPHHVRHTSEKVLTPSQASTPSPHNFSRSQCEHHARTCRCDRGLRVSTETQ